MHGESWPQGRGLLFTADKDCLCRRAGDERVYNVLFFFQAGDRNILGTFYCLFEEYDRWKPMVWEMMQSIEVSVDERI